jgi:hypothetical protein
MEAIISRGGGKKTGEYLLTPSLKDFIIVNEGVKTQILNIQLYQEEFTANSKMIIDNIFQEHRARRYLQGCAQKFKTIRNNKTYLSSSNCFNSNKYYCLNLLYVF